jgi:hypothetical protein
VDDDRTSCICGKGWRLHFIRIEDEGKVTKVASLYVLVPGNPIFCPDMYLNPVKG